VSVLCACIFIVCFAFDKVLLKNSITTTTTSRHLLQIHRCTKRARWIHTAWLMATTQWERGARLVEQPLHASCG